MADRSPPDFGVDLPEANSAHAITEDRRAARSGTRKLVEAVTSARRAINCAPGGGGRSTDEDVSTPRRRPADRDHRRGPGEETRHAVRSPPPRRSRRRRRSAPHGRLTGSTSRRGSRAPMTTRRLRRRTGPRCGARQIAAGRPGVVALVNRWTRPLHRSPAALPSEISVIEFSSYARRVLCGPISSTLQSH